jgi:hypothetical protein
MAAATVASDSQSGIQKIKIKLALCLPSFVRLGHQALIETTAWHAKPPWIV